MQIDIGSDHIRQCMYKLTRLQGLIKPALKKNAEKGIEQS